MKKIILFCFVSFLSLCHHVAFATLELELTQGIDSALPIAILNFKEQGAKPSALQKQASLSEIIIADLQNSGRFKTPSTTVLKKLNQTPKLIKWRKQGYDQIVTGNVTYGADAINISFKLQQTQGKKPILIEKSFKIKPNQWRALAHHISDSIYLTLTGERGVFSTRIAYVVHQFKSEKEQSFTLEVADADGHNPKPLLISKQPIMSPAWSPDGKQLAYVSFENRRAGIFRVQVATGERELITNFPGINGAPAWSPDGKKIALVLSKSGYPKIYVVDVKTKSLSQITDGWSIDTEPSWSPDGNALLFTSNRGGSPQIYQVDLISNNVKRVTFEGNYNAKANFTPDGKSIVMLHREKGMFNIGVLEVTTGYNQSITRAGVDESPSVAPNGKMVLYATRFAGNRVLSLVSLDGRVHCRLPARTGQVQEPAWSPFLG